MKIVPIYAALLAVLFLGLSVRTLRLRRRHRVAIGDGGSEQLARAIRAHSNFAEYVPMALILLAILEGLQARPSLLHGLGAALLIGRAIHAAGLSSSPEPMALRVAGMTLTLGSLCAAALAIFWLAAV